MQHKGKEKMRIIPGSIYLPRKHFPTKQKYQQETAERERERQSRGQFKAHKRTTDCLKEKNAMLLYPPQIFVYRLQILVFAFKGGKGTLHAGVVKKVQISW